MKGLKHKADHLVAQGGKVIFGCVGDIFCGDQNSARRWFIQPGQEAQQCCFAAATAAFDDQIFPRGYLKRYIIQDRNLAGPYGVSFGDTFGFYDIHRDRPAENLISVSDRINFCFKISIVADAGNLTHGRLLGGCNFLASGNILHPAGPYFRDWARV